MNYVCRCMYVCIYACIYMCVCMHSCMYGCLYARVTYLKNLLICTFRFQALGHRMVIISISNFHTSRIVGAAKAQVLRVSFDLGAEHSPPF